MKPVFKLAGAAARYWRRHASRLEGEGRLTPANADTFCLCCQLWGRAQALAPLADADPKVNRTYLDTVKAWQSIAKGFGLLGDPAATTAAKTDEFGIAV